MLCAVRRSSCTARADCQVIIAVGIQCDVRLDRHCHSRRAQSPAPSVPYRRIYVKSCPTTPARTKCTRSVLAFLYSLPLAPTCFPARPASAASMSTGSPSCSCGVSTAGASIGGGLLSSLLRNRLNILLKFQGVFVRLGSKLVVHMPLSQGSQRSRS